LALCLTIACGSAIQGKNIAQEHSLSALQHKTGCVLLGLLDTVSGKWATILKHQTREPSAASDRLIPEIGQELLITIPQDVYIVAYSVAGERDRLLSPADMPLSKDNATGVVLPIGSKVVVKDIGRGEVAGTLQPVWARVGMVQ
jgi:hypothetical protein